MTRAEYRKARELLGGHKSKTGYIRFADGSMIIDFGRYYSLRAKDGQTVDTAYRIEDFRYQIEGEVIRYGHRI